LHLLNGVIPYPLYLKWTPGRDRVESVAQPCLRFLSTTYFLRLQHSSMGCFIKNICFNACMFVDDLLLLCISISDIFEMIIICKTELEWLDMTINVTKSTCIRIGNRFDSCYSVYCALSIDGVDIAWSEEIRYLGLYIVASRTFKCNIHRLQLRLNLSAVLTVY